MSQPGHVSKVLRNAGVYALLGLISLVFLVPFYWMIVSGFRTLADIYAYPIKWLPTNLSLDNYRVLFTQTTYLRAYLNSVVVSVIYVSISLIVCSAGGYALAKFDFPGKNILFLMFMSTIMVPSVLFMIPQFMIVKSFGWMNSYWALIMPKIGNVTALFLMRQFMYGIPDELMDAAKIDGCSEIGLFGRVVLPLVRPGMLVTGILLFGVSWNDFLWPLIVCSQDTMYTLPVIMSVIRGMRFESQAEIVPYHIIMAAGTLVVVPLALIFIRLQRKFMDSVVTAALKG